MESQIKIYFLKPDLILDVKVLDPPESLHQHQENQCPGLVHEYRHSNREYTVMQRRCRLSEPCPVHSKWTGVDIHQQQQQTEPGNSHNLFTSVDLKTHLRAWLQERLHYEKGNVLRQERIQNEIRRLQDTDVDSLPRLQGFLDGLQRPL